MLAEHYYQCKQTMLEDGAILCYTGYVTEDVLFALGDTLKRKLTADDAEKGVVRRLFSIFVEQVQNVIRYSGDQLPVDGDPVRHASSGVIVVGAKNDEFFVVCGNTLAIERAPVLKDRLSEVQGMDKEALRSLYKEKLKDEPDEDSLGGSVGLIEIARRSSRPIEFDFKSLDANREFFCLKAYI